MKILATMLAVLVMALLSACQSTAERVQEEGGVVFSKAEVIAFLSDKTERWSEGGGYFGPDGTLNVKWKGEFLSGTWHATDDGEVCYSVTEWGSIPCTKYFRRGSDIVTVYKNKEEVAPADEYLQGDQTATL